MNSPIGRSYPKRGQRSATSYASRRQRRSAGVPARGPIVDQSGAAAQKYTQVLRNPISPLDEPYFGNSPSASFKVPVWVKVSDLTEEEKLKYEETEKMKEEERLAWKNAMEARRASEMDTKDDAGEKEDAAVDGAKNDNGNEDKPSDGDQCAQIGEEQQDKQQIETTSEEKPTDVGASEQEEIVASASAVPSELKVEEVTAQTLNATSDEPIEGASDVGESSMEVETRSHDHMQSEPTLDEATNQTNNEEQVGQANQASVEDLEESEPLQKKRRVDGPEELVEQQQQPDQ